MHAELGDDAPEAQAKEGVLLKESETIRSWNTRFAVLANRVLSYWDSSELRARGEKPRGVIALANCGVYLAVDDPEHRDSFYIETPSDARRLAAQRSQTRMYFQTETLSELSSWLRALQIASREPWQADASTKACPRCHLVGFDVFKRRHHCRRCGSVVCELCAPGKAALPLYGYAEPVRVCRDCSAESGPVPTAEQRAERSERSAAETERRVAAEREAMKQQKKNKAAFEADDRKAKIRADLAAKSKK